MDAFWRKGYEATSLSELCSCTGLHKGSLYQAFGDKHELFMRALQHYADMEFNEVMKVASQADTPLGAVRAAVDKISCDSGSEKGCLVINGAA
jgi:TetR/AcrR family transcriptional repressor of nem operon